MVKIGISLPPCNVWDFGFRASDFWFRRLRTSGLRKLIRVHLMGFGICGVGFEVRSPDFDVE